MVLGRTEPGSQWCSHREEFGLMSTSQTNVVLVILLILASLLLPGATSAQINDYCLSNVLVGYTLLWEVRHAPTGEPG